MAELGWSPRIAADEQRRESHSVTIRYGTVRYDSIRYPTAGRASDGGCQKDDRKEQGGHLARLPAMTLGGLPRTDEMVLRACSGGAGDHRATPSKTHVRVWRRLTFSCRVRQGSPRRVTWWLAGWAALSGRRSRWAPWVRRWRTAGALLFFPNGFHRVIDARAHSSIRGHPQDPANTLIEGPIFTADRRPTSPALDPCSMPPVLHPTHFFRHDVNIATTLSGLKSSRRLGKPNTDNHRLTRLRLQHRGALHCCSCLPVIDARGLTCVCGVSWTCRLG